MYYRGIHYNVVLLDDDFGVSGSVWKNPDDSYTIFINARLCSEDQKKVFEHELSHIINNDFEKSDVDQIEMAAHNI